MELRVFVGEKYEGVVTIERIIRLGSVGKIRVKGILACLIVKAKRNGKECLINV